MNLYAVLSVCVRCTSSGPEGATTTKDQQTVIKLSLIIILPGEMCAESVKIQF